jgi:hypothetical protein
MLVPPGAACAFDARFDTLISAFTRAGMAADGQSQATRIEIASSQPGKFCRNDEQYP